MCGSLDFQIKIKGLSLQLIASHPFRSDSRGQEHPAANELGWVPTSLGNIISKLSINLYSISLLYATSGPVLLSTQQVPVALYILAMIKAGLYS